MQIISHKSGTIHWICTKVDTMIRLWTPFLCTNFQGNRNTFLCFIEIFASVRKDEEEIKSKEKTKLWLLITRNGLSNCLQIWNVDFSSW